MPSDAFRTRLSSLVLFLVLSGCLLGVVNAQTQDDSFDWGGITPSENLTWQPCFTDQGPFECVRLSVPLDYASPSTSPASIAITRLPANSLSGEYRGPILFNPGGPRGSGVEFVRIQGQDLQIVLGGEFDLVGFDPRGVGHSTPSVSFYTSAVERQLWADLPGSLDLNLTSAALGQQWAKSQITNQLAAKRAGDVLPYIQTDYTARDMGSILDAYGEEKLKYWGYSYGSILGMSFATMFPDKVDKIVVDGVVDADDYYNTDWYANLLDTDNALKTFFSLCLNSTSCPFNFTSVDEAISALHSLYDRLREQPLPIQKHGVYEYSYGVLDVSRLKLTLIGALYAPYVSWPPLASALASLINENNGTELFDMVNVTAPYASLCQSEDSEFHTGHEVQQAILCMDGKEIPNTWEDTKAHLERVGELTPVSELGGVWAAFRTGCSGLPKLAKDIFQGPVGANTDNPMLFVGNEADPVTPHSGAEKISQRFGDAGFLGQNGSGHTSIASPSLCTSLALRAYFTNGTLPEEETWCDVLGSPFEEDEPNPGKTEEERAIVEAMWRVAKRGGVVG